MFSSRFIWAWVLLKKEWMKMEMEKGENEYNWCYGVNLQNWLIFSVSTKAVGY